MAPPTTLITPDYLRKIQQVLMELQDQVDAQLQGDGTFTDGNGDTWQIPVADSNLNVLAGGPSSGQGSFDAAKLLNTQLGAAGGSINEQLLNWQKWLRDMISDISTTITNFGNVNDLNTETVQQLLNDFPAFTTDMGTTGNGGPGGSGG